MKNNVFMMNGIVYEVTDQHPIISDLVLYESGSVVQVKSLAHIEVLITNGAKVLRPINSYEQNLTDYGLLQDSEIQ